VGSFLVIVACAVSLVACATITKGTTQVVAIDTPGTPGATCTIQTQNGPQLVTTPGSRDSDKRIRGLANFMHERVLFTWIGSDRLEY
jgi:hypothetical protein